MNTQGLRFLDYANELADAKSWQPSTEKTFRAVLRAHLVSLHDEQIDTIRFSRILKLKKALFAQGLATSTVKSAMRILHMILTAAAADGKAAAPPAMGTLKSKDDKQSERESEDTFTLDEIQAILGAVDAHYLPFFTVWSLTGCRPSELAALRWSDIDFDKNTISISKAYTAAAPTGKRAKDCTKTERDRTVPLLAAAKEVLADLPRTQGFVFTTRRGNPLNENISKTFKKACLAAGVKPRRSYVIRHSWAINSLRGGVSIDSVAALLGHTKVRTTMDIYMKNFSWQPSDVSKLEQAHAG